jgi:RNA polymerase sigma-70 factor (ECF subfamily)
MRWSLPSHEDILDQLGPVQRYALVLTRDPDQAEELVQDALTRAIAGASTWRPTGSLRRWLLSIVHNTHVSRLRRRRSEAAASEQLEWLADEPAPAPQLVRIEYSRTIRALLSLPQEQREVLMLIAFDGMSYKEAASILDIPIGTLMSRLGRGREALRLARDKGLPVQDRRNGSGPALRLVSRR